MILSKLIPLYFIIALGYIVSRLFKAEKETIARILIYIIAPIVIFYGTYTVKISFANLTLPLLFYVICSFLSLTFLIIGNIVYKKDSTKNILAFTSGSGNTGYFGLPLVLMILGDNSFNLSVLSLLGFIIYENTVGFFIIAKGKHTIKESLIKVIKLPTIYAFFIGLLFNYLNIEIGEHIITTLESFKGAYTVLGMMIIGMGLANIRREHFDIKFISLSFFAKFIIWPSLILLIIWLDKTFIHLYNDDTYNLLLLLSIVPLAANTVTYATELKTHPNKASIAVILSTLFSLLYIPLIASLFIIN